MKSNLTITALDELKPQQVAELSAVDLIILQNEINEAAAIVKMRADNLHAGLMLRYGNGALNKSRDAGKEGGTERIMDSDAEHICEVDIPKTIEWDQELLSTIYDRIQAAGESPLVYMKRSLAVSETTLKEWPTDVQKEFRSARSFKNGRLRFRIRKAKTAERG